ncbi:hypothetical protein HN385_01735 [archaeon]|jgi:hypothetical protein|nr:hypothetical protein [archaeon]MBT3451551.1 hypothetical protein [archaeon]MBT6869410.1 hypothetical protein [archaeon]MBT7192573.1 hypothetical protein [archaeon]MBT7380649.1 hypothetical protein [archaeon]
MIINLSKQREEYFRDWQSLDVLKHFDLSGKHTKTVLQELSSQQRLVVGTKEGKLEGLLEGDYTLDRVHVIKKIIEEMDENSLLVLPEEYKIPSPKARRELVYSTKGLLNLDSMHLRRRIIDQEIPSGQMLSAKRKQGRGWSDDENQVIERFQWAPERVYEVLFNYLNENEKLHNQTFVARSWRGKDKRRRVASFYRDILGTRIRAFQNLAYFKIGENILRKELRNKTRLRNGQPLNEEQLQNRKEKLKRYQPAERHLKPILDKLDCSIWDFIETHYETDRGTRRVMEVPSMTRPIERPRGFKFPKGKQLHQRMSYDIELFNIPLFEEGDLKSISEIWNLATECGSKDFRYRSRHYREEAHKGREDILFTKHAIAAYLSLITTVNNDYKETKHKKVIEHSPFLLPLKKTLDLLDIFEHRTLVLDHTDKDGLTNSTPNHTEIDSLLIDSWKVYPYNELCTTSQEVFKRNVGNVYNALFKFERI